jgi:hypothetical protein
LCSLPISSFIRPPKSLHHSSFSFCLSIEKLLGFVPFHFHLSSFCICCLWRTVFFVLISFFRDLFICYFGDLHLFSWHMKTMYVCFVVSSIRYNDFFFLYSILDAFFIHVWNFL